MTNNESKIRVIKVIPYNSKWIDEFKTESENILKIMENDIVKIHHIGSTSIPRMSAKSVIDILIEINNIKNVDKYNNAMKSIGYEVMGEYGIIGRRFFLKGIYNRTHHVHIFQVGNPEIKRHLNFRDYMTVHPKEAEKYSKLKQELALEFPNDINGYCNGKDKFIKEIDFKAEVWAYTKIVE
ncbi:GrpB family protein [Clostridium ganghwense]|uniref:GrpB family protein n=1 Tax=Clostridium ganghwense TaxID=312089 RepID=A0ABT4CUF7_9CLOT|nr:GrpB family protein [Clostridium ganghwense]MCY6372684.1 GrpB family protein [Clostridium ganghwense]